MKTTPLVNMNSQQVSAILRRMKNSMSSQLLVISTFLLSTAFISSGCAMANAVSRPLPIASQVPRAEKQAEGIEIYQQGASPQKAVVLIANIGAHGNGYATMDTLENAIKKEAAKIGADLVILTQYEVSKDETIGTYGGGLFTAQQIQRPHLYGVAAVYARVSLGVVFESYTDTTIKYVHANSPAAKAGLKEGMKVLAVSGVYLADRPVVEKEISIKKPGDSVTVEYLDNSKEKRKVSVVLDSN